MDTRNKKRLVDFDIHELAPMLRAPDSGVTSTKLTEAYLERIEQFNGPFETYDANGGYNAFVRIYRQDALEQAREVDALLAKASNSHHSQAFRSASRTRSLSKNGSARTGWMFQTTSNLIFAACLTAALPRWMRKWLQSFAPSMQSSLATPPVRSFRAISMGSLRATPGT
jgi:hypothetical protein